MHNTPTSTRGGAASLDAIHQRLHRPLHNGSVIHRDDGTIYVGALTHGLPSGFGVCYYPCGTIYAGNFANGKQDGEGTMLYASGDAFVGHFSQSAVRDGISFSGGEQLLINFVDGQLHQRRFEADAGTSLKELHAALFASLLQHMHRHVYDLHAADITAAAAVAAAAVEEVRWASAAAPLRQAMAPTTPPHLILDEAPAPLPMLDEDAPTHHDGGDGGVMMEHGGNLRAAMTHQASIQTIFACSGPAAHEQFSFSRFLLRLFVFLVPVFSLTWMPWAPLRITSLEMEREFVVSGATLRRDVDPPSTSLTVIVVALCSQLIALILIGLNVPLGSSEDGELTLAEVLLPWLLWLVVALILASYHAYTRAPHCLERLDRQLTPKLSAFAASVVDSNSAVCIHTWDEEGRGKVMNPHYHYRWLCFSTLTGIVFGVAGPITRICYGHPFFVGTGFKLGASILCCISTFLLASLLSYIVLKITDLEREVGAKLRVLTDIAFIEKKSLLNPSLQVSHPLYLDRSVDVADVFRGFPGWFVCRSLILYASTSANHCARSAAMSIFMLAMMSCEVVAIGNAVSKNTFRYSHNYHYGAAYTFAILLFLMWGYLLYRYLAMCGQNANEVQRHLHLMDISALYHLVRRHDAEGSNIIHMCRELVAEHDARPHFFQAPLYPLLSVLVVTLNLFALVAVVLSLASAIRYYGVDDSSK